MSVAVPGNLAANPGFEANPAASYFSNGPCAFSWATDQAYSPTHSLKIVSTASTLCRWLSTTSGANAIPVVAGSGYYVSGWLRTEGTTASGWLSVNFWTAAGVYIPATVDSAGKLVGSRGWTELSLTTTAPAGAAFLRVEFRLTGPGTLWADDVYVSSAADGPPVLLAPPSISGADYVGQAPVGDPGSWGGSQPITFQTTWYYCTPYDCSPTMESTPGTYAFPYPQDLAAGYRVVFIADARNALGSAQAVAGGYIQPLPGSPPALTVAPQMDGTARVGETLRTTAGTWIGAGSFAYQWVRCYPPPWLYDPAGSTCTDIPGATGSRYVPTALDIGSALQVRVIASNANGSTAEYALTGSPWLVWSEPVGAQSNLVPNPDVEAQPDSYYTQGTGTFSWATDASRSGTHALKVVSSQSAGSIARWMTQIPAIPVSPGKAYDVSAWLKAQNVDHGNAQLVVTYWTAAQVYVAGSATSDAGQRTGTRDWAQAALLTTAPAGAAFMRVEFRLSGPGILWADDVSVAAR